jgi:diguanylate cyclase (GGDEF)-like protein
MSGSQLGARVRLKGSVLVGRDPAADLVLLDPEVSWHHLKIEDRGGEHVLIDLASSNGTRVADELASTAVLQPNDRILLGGETLLLFEVQDPIEQDYDEHVRQLLERDELTGLLVRRKFDADVSILRLAAENDESPFGLLAMDLDGVKVINDAYGHHAGARAIEEAGRIIGRVVGHRGFASRFGGDEFLAALRSHDRPSAAEVGEEIRAAIEACRVLVDGAELSVRVSIGVAAFPADGGDCAALVERADQALYRAKQAGRGCAVPA